MIVHARWVLMVALWLWTGLALAGTKYYYYTDPQGTVLAEADAQGNIVASYDYAPYGAQVLGTPPSGPAGYTGHVNDAESGFVYMQQRYYDPGIGRFLSVDPVGPKPGNGFGFNRYGYANNNPITNIDPDGRDNCPGQERAKCIRSDAGAAKDLRRTASQEAAARDTMGKLETSFKPERAVALVGTTDVTVQPAGGVPTSVAGKTDGIDFDNLPAGTSAVEHSHIDGHTHGISSDGFNSGGDAQPLMLGKINFVVSEHRLAVYEIVDGRIQITVLKGSFTSRESNTLEKSINAQQPEVDARRPQQ